MERYRRVEPMYRTPETPPGRWREGPPRRRVRARWTWTLLLVASLAFVGFDCRTDRGAQQTSPPPTTDTRADAEELKHLSREQPLMGTTFGIDVRTSAPDRGGAAIADAFREVERVEHLISSWESSSELSEVNRMAGRRPVEVGPELLELVQTAVDISRKTDGAFDITFASCESLWSFRDRQIPTDEQLRDCRTKVDWERIDIVPESSTIYLPDDSLQIGVGGIGKGYGVDRAASVLEESGVRSYMIDGGGDVRARAAEHDRAWRVGIAHPRKPTRLLGQLRLREGAVVTSGDYERFFQRDGKRYHHIIDPETARPARKSVATSVWADQAAEADALATGLFVLGPKRGIDLAEQLPGVEALIVGPDLELHTTSGFAKRFVPTEKAFVPQ